MERVGRAGGQGRGSAINQKLLLGVPAAAGLCVGTKGGRGLIVKNTADE